MRRRNHIVTAVVLACLLAALWGAFRLCRHYLPWDGTTCDLYERYKDDPHLRATFMRGYSVSDTLSADALLLRADSDSAWYALLVDFGMPEKMIELYKTNKEFFVGEGANSIIKISIDKNDIRKRIPMTDPDSRLIIGSIAKRSLCVFITDDISVKETICSTETKKIKE